ncbi:DUF1016 N-terminal domain-containing protein [Leptospira wolffii]|uniref:DUF1016 N-terminal domain-containing protein n=1 Tax=Leptospira wolffii TaxID=409998 RepID=UPI0003530E91|nr:DUF1016 N-terminal domain-containing protein [Leptospira wolffii]EPG65765.1 PF06250 domain protein [Leptospira wolffii serovar Khorat str. Khorat-H2]
MYPKRFSPGLSPNTYQSLLTDVARIYEDFQSTANSDWNKSSLVGNWKIGQRIVEVEQGNRERAVYGDRILKQLSQDLNRRFGKGFSDRNLRYMRRFYQFYKLSSIHPELSWTHYRVLLLVEDSKTRGMLEKKAIAQGWSHRDLLLEAQATLKKSNGDSSASESEIAKEAEQGLLKRPVLGLYSYRLVQNFSSNLERSVPNLDLGFDVKIEHSLGGVSEFSIGSIVTVKKIKKRYSFERISGSKSLFAFKAFLEKVIDGDTISVNIDLGFHVFIRKRLRLRGLDAPELGTKKGVTCKKFVESQLRDCSFLLIKTYGSDKYDRYLADVIYLKKEEDTSIVIKDGLFLNNELLKKGFVVPV